MALTGDRTFVGFGFGAIQAGLMLLEAWRSGRFARLVVAEVVPDVVARLHAAGGTFTVNVAHDDRLEAVELGPVECLDPSDAADRAALVEAIASAHEMATAIPSVSLYATEGPGSLHRVLAEGLRRKAAASGPRAVVSACENDIEAAAKLRALVEGELPAAERVGVLERVRFLDTVIGKMSGVVTDAAEIEARSLARVTPSEPRAFLVESFNRILISRIAFEPSVEGDFQRGIEIFEEKDDLAPFEAAKLYGHNAVHALAAYVGAARGVERIADLAAVPGVWPFLRAAFIEESGAALVELHEGVDALFTHEGFRASADDLLRRMRNPYLRDTVERVGRDPARKLGWDDRLVGTMRQALRCEIEPRRFALGAAAALAALDATVLAKPPADASARLGALWRDTPTAADERAAVRSLVEAGLARLRRWQDAGFPDLELEMLRE